MRELGQVELLDGVQLVVEPRHLELRPTPSGMPRTEKDLPVFRPDTTVAVVTTG
jgi:hypothetical protein